jgi:ElaB/YqjD/DUF883 family membrane-anchored ribosome-binding protein
MNEEPRVSPEGSDSSSSQAKTDWQEVGQQFQALGESLAQAVRTAWENEETQKRVQEMRSGLESMVEDVREAIDESSKSDEAQKLREEAGRTVESLRSAGEKTAQEVRPQLIHALQQLNSELQKLINRMEQEGTSGTERSRTDESSGPDVQI